MPSMAQKKPTKTEEKLVITPSLKPDDIVKAEFKKRRLEDDGDRVAKDIKSWTEAVEAALASYDEKKEKLAQGDVKDEEKTTISNEMNQIQGEIKARQNEKAVLDEKETEIRRDLQLINADINENRIQSHFLKEMKDIRSSHQNIYGFHAFFRVNDDDLPICDYGYIKCMKTGVIKSFFVPGDIVSVKNRPGDELIVLGAATEDNSLLLGRRTGPNELKYDRKVEIGKLDLVRHSSIDKNERLKALGDLSPAKMKQNEPLEEPTEAKQEEHHDIVDLSGVMKAIDAKFETLSAELKNSLSDAVKTARKSDMPAKDIKPNKEVTDKLSEVEKNVTKLEKAIEGLQIDFAKVWGPKSSLIKVMNVIADQLKKIDERLSVLEAEGPEPADSDSGEEEEQVNSPQKSRQAARTSVKTKLQELLDVLKESSEEKATEEKPTKRQRRK